MSGLQEVEVACLSELVLLQRCGLSAGLGRVAFLPANAQSHRPMLRGSHEWPFIFAHIILYTELYKHKGRGQRDDSVDKMYVQARGPLGLQATVNADKEASTCSPSASVVRDGDWRVLGSSLVSLLRVVVGKKVESKDQQSRLSSGLHMLPPPQGMSRQAYHEKGMLCGTSGQPPLCKEK